MPSSTTNSSSPKSGEPVQPPETSPPEASPEGQTKPAVDAKREIPQAVPCRVTCRAPKVEIDLHASIFRRQGELTNSASSCSYVLDGTVFFNSHSACDGAVTLDESDGGSILLDCSRIKEDRLIVMCASCYNNENILDLPGLEFLIKSEVDGRVLYRATSDDIFERKFGAKLAAQVKRSRQSDEPEYFRIGNKLSNAGWCENRPESLSDVCLLAATFKQPQVHVPAILLLPLPSLLTQLPTTSVSSTFVRLTDGGGSVHYPSVIVGVFVFDQGEWHFVRVGQTCQGTNMISMKADIASVPPKVTRDKIESSGLSYKIFDPDAKHLGVSVGSGAQDSDTTSGGKSVGPQDTPDNMVPKDEYEALVAKFQALAKAHDKLQTEYSALEIEVTHRDAKIEQLSKKYRAMESRYESVLHQSQLASSDFSTVLSQNLELKQALEEKVGTVNYDKEASALPLAPHHAEEVEPVDQHAKDHSQSGSRSVPKPFRGFTKMLKGSKKKSSPAGKSTYFVSLKILFELRLECIGTSSLPRARITALLAGHRLQESRIIDTLRQMLAVQYQCPGESSRD
ncbi:AN1-type zinc finger protein 2A [Perkinsus chesapeaki]|uniref:AN1-type zinc finger protein 2A n=1 Tax=Perkinsus chesapeaki TaxID=330153 RepID=A0A7J6MFX1_PERCH|nr:AN1-type zinc finger protein 2A [Perkinsus chesapeaki]